MERAIKTTLAGLSGTTLMTLFSYLLGQLVKDDFNEAEHLSTLVRRLLPGYYKTSSKLTGWALHYAVGLLFAAVYMELWERGKLPADLKNAPLLGAISGGLAVAIWKLTLKMHPWPPLINYRNYYLQLIPAHIVFALGATLSYRLLKKRVDQLTIHYSLPTTNKFS